MDCQVLSLAIFIGEGILMSDGFVGGDKPVSFATSSGNQWIG